MLRQFYRSVRPSIYLTLILSFSAKKSKRIIFHNLYVRIIVRIFFYAETVERSFDRINVNVNVAGEV